MADRVARPPPRVSVEEIARCCILRSVRAYASLTTVTLGVVVTGSAVARVPATPPALSAPGKHQRRVESLLDRADSVEWSAARHERATLLRPAGQRVPFTCL